jgi:hypothetical protein
MSSSREEKVIVPDISAGQTAAFAGMVEAAAVT